MTTQEAYDQIRTWFSRPDAEYGGTFGEIGYGISCCYRKDGDVNSQVRCGVGCLIPDELYSPDFENMTVEALLGTHESMENFFADVDTAFLDEVQVSHDRHFADGASIVSFIEDLDAIAVNYNLTVPA